MGVPERVSRDLASVPFQRAGTQADGGAMEASTGIAERNASQPARSIILLLYPRWARISEPGGCVRAIQEISAVHVRPLQLAGQVSSSSSLRTLRSLVLHSM